jgi:hypothetical protein
VLVLSVAYPGGDVVILTLAVITITRAEVGRRLSLVLVTVSLAALSVADSAFVLFNLDNSAVADKLSDAGWFVGYLVFGLAALVTAVRPASEGEAELTDRYRRLQTLLPYLFVPGVLMVAAVREANGQHIAGMLFWSTPIITSRPSLP